MSILIILHIMNEDPIVGEVEELPDPTDQFVNIANPRLRDGKDLHYLEDEATAMIIPWHRINFVEIMPSADLEDVVSIVREE
jgi:hypothetical protein